METFRHLLQLPFELMRSTDTFETLMGWLLLTVYIAVVWVTAHLIIRGTYRFLDRLELEVRQEDGVVTRKEHRPGYHQTAMVYNPALRMMMPSSYYVPPRWRIRASLRNGHEGWMKVSQAQYDRVQDLQRLRATYRVGRFSGKLYIDRLELPRP